MVFYDYDHFIVELVLLLAVGYGIFDEVQLLNINWVFCHEIISVVCLSGSQFTREMMMILMISLYTRPPASHKMKE